VTKAKKFIFKGKDMKKETKELLLQLEPFAESQGSIIQSFIDKLKKEKEQKLPQVFEDKLATVGNNPIEEPKIAELRDEINKKLKDGEIDKIEALLDIIEGIYTIDELNNMDTDIKELIKLGSRLSVQVFGYTYEDENKNTIYKEVPSQDDLQPLSYSQKREVRKLIKDSRKIYDEAEEKANKIDLKIENGEDVSTLLEESTEAFKKVSELAESNKEKILGMCNLDYKSMSEWEQELLHQKLIANASGNYQPKVGKK
jgi:hypothetical protein